MSNMVRGNGLTFFFLFFSFLVAPVYILLSRLHHSPLPAVVEG